MNGNRRVPLHSLRFALAGVGMACLMGSATGCAKSSQPRLSALSKAVALPSSVSAAIAKLQHETFHAEATKTMSVDGQGLATLSPPPSLPTQKLIEDIESATRMASILSTAGHPDIHLVAYDGSAFVSTDGSTYLEAPSLQTLVHSSPQLSSDVMEHLTAVSSAVSTTNNGVAADRFDAILDPAYLPTLSKNVLGQLPPPPGTADAGGQIMWKSTTFSFFVDPSAGQLVADNTTSTATVDLGAFIRALTGTAPSGLTGSVQITAETSTVRTGFGSSISVPKPTSSGALSSQDLSKIFGPAIG
jgi:hypothetical protein